MMHERPFRRASADGAAPLYRACVLRALRAREPETERYREEPLADLVLRAAEQPTMLLGNTALQGVLTEFLGALAAVSAAAGLFRLSINLSFGNAAEIALPYLSDLPLADFIYEGAPFPVVQGVTTLASMTPAKMGTIVPLSNEMMQSSLAETVVRQTLINNIGPALDRRLFDGSPAVPGLRPAGLLFGVPAEPPANTGDPSDDIVADIENLVDALAPYGGNGQIALITSPRRAVRISTRWVLGALPFPLLISASPTLADNLIAVATGALAVAIDPARIDVSGQMLVHMEDTDPLPIVDDAGVMAAPVRSAWQTDSVGLRFTLPVSWALCAPAVAWTNPGW